MDTMAELLRARVGDPHVGLMADDETWTWDDVVAAAATRAAVLAERRGPGPFHVATLLDNVPEHVLWLSAAALAGAVLVGGNTTHRGGDLARDLAHTECQLLVTDTAHLPLVDGLDLGPGIGPVEGAGPRVVVVDDPGYAAGARPPRRGGPARPRRRRRGGGQPRLPHLHVGDLGRAQGVPLHPRAVWLASGSSWPRCTASIPDDTCYAAMPLFHSNALMAGLAPAIAGGCDRRPAHRRAASRRRGSCPTCAATG